MPRIDLHQEWKKRMTAFRVSGQTARAVNQVVDTLTKSLRQICPNETSIAT